MSIIAKRGRAAAESATQEKQDFSKALVPFKSGTTYKVRVPGNDAFVEWYCHSVFKIFYSTPCTKPTGKPDLYDIAVDNLYAAAKEATSEAEAESLRDHAYQLKAKPRYLFAFFNLEDGEPIVVDVSKAQAQVLIQSIDRYEKRLDRVAFELSKTGQSTSTVVSLTPVLDMEEDLTDAERKHFEDTRDKTIDDGLYEGVLYVKTEAEQLADLKQYAQKTGIDLSLLGIDETADDDDADEVIPINDSDTPEDVF